jgi:transcriptional regulator with XRE-family HTH domain
MVCGASLGHRLGGGGLGEGRSGPVSHKPEATPQASVTYLNAVERDERNSSADNITRIAKALKVELGDPQQGLTGSSLWIKC